MQNKPIEKYVLAGALAFLAIGSAALAFFFPTVNDITRGANDFIAKRQPPELQQDGSELLVSWQNPPNWQEPENEHRLFASKDIIFDGQKFIMVDKNPEMQISGLITLGWAKQYNLDVRDPDLRRRDPDADGFYNELEYVGETSPIDAAEHPPFIERLRLESVEIKPFKVLFRSYAELSGQPIFYVDVPSPRQDVKDKVFKTELFKIGDVITGSKWKIVDFRENIVIEKNPNTGIEQEYDRSELTLQHTEVPLTKVIIKGGERDAEGRPVPDDLREVSANLLMLMPKWVDKPMRVNQGEDFSIPQDPETTYKLMEADEEKALIKNIETNEERVIPKVTAEELDLVPGDTPPLAGETPGSESN